MDGAQAHIPPGMLLRLITDKRNRTAHYEHIRGMPSEPRPREMIGRVAEDEKRQLDEFIRLYVHLFGESPPPEEPAVPAIESLAENLRYLFSAEVRSYTQYYAIFSADRSPEVREVFQRALMEENIHTTKLNHILIDVLPGNGTA